MPKKTDETKTIEPRALAPGEVLKEAKAPDLQVMLDRLTPEQAKALERVAAPSASLPPVAGELEAPTVEIPTDDAGEYVPYAGTVAVPEGDDDTGDNLQWLGEGPPPPYIIAGNEMIPIPFSASELRGGVRMDPMKVGVVLQCMGGPTLFAAPAAKPTD